MIKKFELALLVSTLVISTLLTNYSNASTEELTQWLIADEISTLESEVFALTPVMDKNISKALVTDVELKRVNASLATTEKQLREALLMSQTTNDGITALTADITSSSIELNAATAEVNASEELLTEAWVFLAGLQSDLAVVAKNDPLVIELNGQIDLLENSIISDVVLALNQAQANQAYVKGLLLNNKLALLDLQQQLIEDEYLAQQLTNQFQILQDSESRARQDLNVINELIGELKLKELGIKESYTTELNLVRQHVAELSNSQAKVLLQTLESNSKAGITINLKSTELKTLLDGGYSFQKINLFVKDYVEKAKFLSTTDELQAEAIVNAELME
jgi:hypothetical protein